MKSRPFLSLRLCLPALCSTLLGTHAARAHTLPISTLTLVPDENYLHLELILNPFELTFFSELDANHDGRLDPGEWSGQGEKIAWRILDCLKLRVNDRPVVADIAGLSQSYESHHIAVRAHFAVDARRARVSLDSQLAALTSGSHITQVNFGTGERVQAARLDMQSNKVTFEPAEPADVLGAATGSAGKGAAASSFTAFKVNETAVAALLGLLLMAGIPPLVFCAVVRSGRRAQEQVAPTSDIPATVGIH